MTELLFWETTIRQTPVSFALDITPMLAIGIRIDSLADKQASRIWGWHDLTIYLGPLSLTFTVYGRGA
jgi:hypothetical protein